MSAEANALAAFEALLGEIEQDDCPYGEALRRLVAFEGREVSDSETMRAVAARRRAFLRERFGTLPPTPPETQHVEASADEGPEERDGWPEPLRFGATAHLPAFPLDSLPPSIRLYVEAIAETRQVPPDLPALVALGVLAAAAAGRYHVEIAGDYHEPLNLFVAAVLEPGERKSATFRDMVVPLAEAERDLQEKAAPAIAAANESRKAEEARLDHLRKQSAKEDDPALRARLLQEAQTLAVNLTRVPPEPRLLVGDVTPERLASILSEQSGRIALADAEAGGVFDVLAGRYSTNGRPNLDVFLRGHAGDDLRVDRTGRPSELVRRPALTAILTPQPAVLKRIGETPDLRGRGLLARFLYALPKSRVGRRRFVRAAVPSSVAAAYSEVIRSILSVEPTGDSGTVRGRPLRLSEEALRVWTDHFDGIEKRQAEGGDLHPTRDWASKAPGAAARIAGHLHLAEGRRDEAPISDVTMAAAWRVLEYLTLHAVEAFSVMATDPDVEMARKLSRWIAEGHRERVSIRDAHKNFPSFGEPSDFAAPFRVLVGRGIVRPAPGQRSGPGRKPSPGFDVNPSFLLAEAPEEKPALLDRSAESAESGENGHSDYSADSPAIPKTPGPALTEPPAAEEGGFEL